MHSSATEMVYVINDVHCTAIKLIGFVIFWVDRL